MKPKPRVYERPRSIPEHVPPRPPNPKIPPPPRLTPEQIKRVEDWLRQNRPAK